MRIDDFSFAFNCPGYPSWGTSIVRQDTQLIHLIKSDVASNIVIGMMHKSVTLNTHDFSMPIGKGSKLYYGDTGFKEATSEPMMVSVFDSVLVNGIKVKASFILTINKCKAKDHLGRLDLKYSPKTKYGKICNEQFVEAARKSLGIGSNTPWVIYEIDILNQEELHFKALVGDDVNDLKNKLRNLPQMKEMVSGEIQEGQAPVAVNPTGQRKRLVNEDYDYISAIKAKPFIILGGFSGTGKSVKVKELAFATCPCNGELNVSETTPGNYLLISVKPNWHDASDITGFRSSISNSYFVTDFMRFLVKARLYPEVPFFVCLDEMNLAPVEEYFADFLSVIESRKKRESDGKIVTEAIVPASVFNDQSYADDFNIFLQMGLKPVVEVNSITEFTAKIKEKGYSSEGDFFIEKWLVEELKRDGLTIPQNVVIIGTVNMDDTTNSFSRKVIDRAMTFETVIRPFDNDYFTSDIPLHYVTDPLSGELFISDEVRATEMVQKGRFNMTIQEKEAILEFINDINEDLDGSPFKISYRILNETILLHRAKKLISNYFYKEMSPDTQFYPILTFTFDDILMEKILPRIEGDYEKCNKCLTALSIRAEKNGWPRSSEKIEFMMKRFGRDKSGFTSFWN